MPNPRVTLTKVNSAPGAAVGLTPLNLDDVSSQACQKAKLIIEYARDSAGALLKACQLLKARRGAKRGMTTDEEQDLLRAMLVMAAGGLDAMTKQLIRDALPLLVNRDHSVKDGLQKFVASRVRREEDTPDLAAGAKFIARVLTASSTQQQVIEEYIQELTGGSLQSMEALRQAAVALGRDPDHCGIDPAPVRAIFQIRNRIIHEMDINVLGKRRKRNLRKQNDMVGCVNTLLHIAEILLREVDSKARAAEQKRD